MASGYKAAAWDLLSIMLLCAEEILHSASLRSRMTNGGVLLTVILFRSYLSLLSIYFKAGALKFDIRRFAALDMQG